MHFFPSPFLSFSRSLSVRASFKSLYSGLNPDSQKTALLQLWDTPTASRHLSLRCVCVEQCNYESLLQGNPQHKVKAMWYVVPWQRMWHIEDKQASPQTQIRGKPRFVFSSCLWKNHGVIVFLSIWIIAASEGFFYNCQVPCERNPRILKGLHLSLILTRLSSVLDSWKALLVLVGGLTGTLRFLISTWPKKLWRDTRPKTSCILFIFQTKIGYSILPTSKGRCESQGCGSAENNTILLAFDFFEERNTYHCCINSKMETEFWQGPVEVW